MQLKVATLLFVVVGVLSFCCCYYVVELRNLTLFGLSSGDNGNRTDSVAASASALAAVICVVVQDDEAYLDEWVDYHHALGFSHFYIYDASDAFEMKQWGENKGEHVTMVHCSGSTIEPTQAYTDCVQRLVLGQWQHQNETTWAAFFTVHDFLILKTDSQQPQRNNCNRRAVVEFLHDYSDRGALSINRVLFGSAGRRVYSPQPVTKRFLFRSNDQNAHDDVRFVVRLSDIDIDAMMSTPRKRRKRRKRRHGDYDVENNKTARFPRLKHPFERRDTSGNVVHGNVNPRRPIDVAVLHHYLLSIKEYNIKFGKGIPVWNETQNVQVNHEYDLFDGTVKDESAWEAVKKLLPNYRKWHSGDLTAEGPVPRYPPLKTNGTAAVCVVMKYEEAYVDEWVDYHHALGFSHFYIYDNSPHFEMEQWASEKGDHVTIQHDPGEAVQRRAYLDCLNEHVVKDGHTWVATFDMDEMIYLKNHSNVVDLLHDHCQEGSLGLNWIFFGPGAQEVYQPLPVTKRFKYRSPTVDRHVKSFARVKDLDLKTPPHMHFPYIINGSHHDVTGKVINQPWYWNEDGPSTVAVIHHYLTKSYKEYIAKRMRGKAGRRIVFEDFLAAVRNRNFEGMSSLFTEDGWEASKRFVPGYGRFD